VPSKTVNIQMLLLANVRESDLHYLAQLDSIGYDGQTAEDLLKAVVDQGLALWRISGDCEGVLLTSLTKKALWVDGIAGKGLTLCAEAIRTKLQTIAKRAGRDHVQCAVSHPVLRKFYERMGAKPIASIMELNQ